MKAERGKVVLVPELPDCNFCEKKANYDFKTRMGPWANACVTHYRQNRLYAVLGTGKGQMLITEES